MPSVLTGANLANRELLYLGVSGDGDSASIGLGQFAHAMRRGVNMAYIVENNGVYGLTKGQFSATADQGCKSKKRRRQQRRPRSTSSRMALQLGATYVARSFSGDKEQLVPLIKGAISHRGAAFIDVISPCVAFNNHPGSTKSYDYVREHNEAVNRLDFMPRRDAITADYAPGEVIEVTQHDGSVLRLRKLAEDYDPSDRLAAMNHIAQHEARGEVVTGLLYVDADADDLHDHLNTVDAPLNRLGDARAVPGRRRRSRRSTPSWSSAARFAAAQPRRPAGRDEERRCSDLVSYGSPTASPPHDGRRQGQRDEPAHAAGAVTARSTAPRRTARRLAHRSPRHVLRRLRPGGVQDRSARLLFAMLEAGARLTEQRAVVSVAGGRGLHRSCDRDGRVPAAQRRRADRRRPAAHASRSTKCRSV